MSGGAIIMSHSAYNVYFENKILWVLSRFRLAVIDRAGRGCCKVAFPTLPGASKASIHKSWFQLSSGMVPIRSVSVVLPLHRDRPPFPLETQPTHWSSDSIASKVRHVCLVYSVLRLPWHGLLRQVTW